LWWGCEKERIMKALFFVNKKMLPHAFRKA